MMDTYEVELQNGDTYQLEADHAPSESEALQAISSHETNPPPFSGILSRVGFPLAASLVGEGILSAIAPQVGLPLMVATSGLAAAGGEAGREFLSEGKLNPREVAETGVGYAAFPGLFKAAAPVAEGLSPVVSRLLPFLKSVGMKGSVLNTAVRGGLASGAIGGGLTVAEEGLQGRIPNPKDVLKTAGLSGLYGGATAGAFQAFGPQRLGGGNFWEALGGNRAKIQALQRGALEEEASADFTRSSEQTRMQQESNSQLETLAQQEDIAKQGMIQQGRKMILGLREDVPSLRRGQAKVAWQPVEDLSQAISDKIDPLEVHHELDAVANGNAGRAQQSQALFVKLLKPKVVSLPTEGATGETVSSVRHIALEDLPPDLQRQALAQLGGTQGSAGVSAKTLIDLSSEAGKKLPQAVKSRAARPDLGDLPSYDVRTAIANVLERHAPEDLKGAFAMGKKQWADHVNDVNLDYKFLRSGSSTFPSTETGSNELQAIAEDLATVGKTSKDIGYWRRLERDLGYSPLEPLTAYAKRLQGLPEARKAIVAQLQEGVGRTQNVFEGRRLQIQEQVQPQVKALQAQATTAKWLARLGVVYPLLYMLRRTVLGGSSR